MQKASLLFTAAVVACTLAVAAGLSLGRCAGGCHQKAPVDLDQVTFARVEMVKQQILSKLRLQEPPSPNLTLAALPRPLATAPLGRLHENSFEEFYGKTDQVIIFPDAGVQSCRNASCFTFKLPASIAEETLVESATLWLHKRTFQSNHLGNPQQINLWANNPPEKIASVWSQLKDSWLKIKLDVVEHWLNNLLLQQGIKVECTTCSQRGHGNSLREDQLPFLVISTKSVAAPQRIRRSINCTPGVKECCRENLHISFSEIGWGNWILQPKGYDAFFCRGSCTNPASVTQSGSFYTSIIQKYLSVSSTKNKSKPDLSPCCTPTKFSSLQLLYVDNNNVVMQKTLPNMVVDSCGCL